MMCLNLFLDASSTGLHQVVDAMETVEEVLGN